MLLECSCRVLEALQWWVQGDYGLRVVVYWGMQVQDARSLRTVVKRKASEVGISGEKCPVEIGREKCQKLRYVELRYVESYREKWLEVERLRGLIFSYSCKCGWEMRFRTQIT